MKKKFFLGLMAIATLAGAMTLAGCDKTNENEGDDGGVAGDATSVTLNQTRLELDINQNFQLEAELPASTKMKTVRWTSSDTKVATVTSAGFVIARGKGTATITAASTKARATCTVTVSGKTYVPEPMNVQVTGGINPTTYNASDNATITFNRFPISAAEFREVRDQIGERPEGAVALQVMAMEMYRRDRAVGLECIKLNNVASNVRDVLDGLNLRFGKDLYTARPYQVASLLQGASYDNGYNPSEPYTIKMQTSQGKRYTKSEMLEADPVIYITVLTSRGEGNSNKLEVEVLKSPKRDQPSNDTYFIVFNSPSLYYQCREISARKTFNGLK